jgi:hypothetical protein
MPEFLPAPATIFLMMAARSAVARHVVEEKTIKSPAYVNHLTFSLSSIDKNGYDTGGARTENNLTAGGRHD